MATDLLTEPETDTETGQPQACEMVELLAYEADCGCKHHVFRKCSQPAAFTLHTRCWGDDAHQEGHRLICAHHEGILRERPELGSCAAGHPSVIVAVLPLGGGS